MENDDVQIGRVLTRREALALLGAAGASMLGAGSGLAHPRAPRPPRLPSCIVRPQQTAGPYFVEKMLNRSDIRSDPADGAVKPGVRLDLTFQVSRISDGGCMPLPDARVDVWQCDALGVYSDVRDINGQFDTVGEKFLRGYQVTDSDGMARFTTIYPGWYPGRTVHIHFRIRTAQIGGGSYEFTSQLYFDDSTTDRVLSREPYASKGERSVRNRHDGIFRGSGEQLLLAVKETGEGYAGTFDVGLQIV